MVLEAQDFTRGNRMSEDIKPTEAKPKGDGLSDSNDVDTRMKYKEFQKGPRGKTPKTKVEVRRNRQREIKLGR